MRIRVDNRGGRGVDPGPVTVDVDGDRIIDVDSAGGGSAADEVQFDGSFALPGLVDLHGHVGLGLSQYAVERNGADGVVAVLSQGDVGPRHVERFLEGGEGSERLLAVNIFAGGEVAPTESELDPDGAAAAVRRWPDRVWGISANVSRHSARGVDPRHIWAAARHAAEAAGAPILFGPRQGEDWDLADQLERLRPGDVVTYMYRARPYCLFDEPRVVDAVRSARARGVCFDASHGSGSFDFAVAERALALGLPPDSASTDWSTLCAGSPPLLGDLVGKLRAVGMSAQEALDAISTTPARVLGRRATLAQGGAADVTIVRWSPPVRLVDTSGAVRTAPALQVLGTVVAGRLIYGPVTRSATS